MTSYLNDHQWVAWVGIAVVLAIVEIFSLDLVLLMFAIGALAAAVVAGLGGPLWLAILVFAAVSFALLFLVRPSVLRRLHDGPTLSVGHDDLIGRLAVVVEPVDARDGRVRLAGELWSARTALDGVAYDTGSEVLITRIDGATAVVTSKEN